MRFSAAAILYLLISLQVNPAHAQLNENCTVSVLNRTARVDTNGNWSIANVPAGFGPVRARAVCLTNGTTSVGQSGLFTVLPNQSTGFDATMLLGPVTPIPDLVTLTSPSSTLASVGATTQLAVNAHYPSTVTANITAAATGTTYTISNPAIATVSTEGLVQAVSSGTVIIQAMNEGATGMTSLRVVLNATDSDHDGIPDDIEIQNGLNPNDPTDALLDADNDGLTNLEEYRLGTNMRNADTDGDGIPDLIEIRLGLNPAVFNITTSLQGRVVNSSGTAVTGASIVAFGLLKTSTDPSGNFLLKVPIGLGDVQVAVSSVAGGQLLAGTSSSMAPVPAGITDLGTITLAPQTNFASGIVTDPQGRPVRGAQVTVATNSLPLQTRTTDSNGRYQVLAGPSLFYNTTAFDPATGYLGNSFSLDVRVGPTGVISGTVFRSDGVTRAGFTFVLVQSGPQSIRTTNTGADGTYSIGNVPPGDFYIQTGSIKTPTQSLVFGERKIVNITLPGQGSVSGTVTDAAGNPVSRARIHIAQEQYRFDTWLTAFNGTFSSQTYNQPVLAGSFTITATEVASGLSATASGTVPENGTANVALQLQGYQPGTVRGLITYDGTHSPDDNTNVFITQPGSQGVLNTFYPPLGGARLENGQYLISGVSQGPFTLTVQTSEGLTTTAEGTVVNVATPVTLNVTLPPTGAVTGTVRNASAAIVVVWSIQLTSPSLNFDAYPLIDAQGAYTFYGIPAGPFVVYAKSNELYPVYGSTAGTLSQAGTTATANITLPGLGSISGTVYLADGVTPAGNTYITVDNYENSSDLGHDSRETYPGTSDQGHYSIPAIQSGKVRVYVSDTFQPLPFPWEFLGNLGYVEATVPAGGNAIANVVLGNALNLNANQASGNVPIQSADGFKYQARECLFFRGGTADGRLSNPFAFFSFSLGMRGGLDAFGSCAAPAYSDLSGQQLVLLPSEVRDGVSVTRKLYVPAAGGFARFLFTFTNPSSVSLTLPVKFLSLLGATSQGIVSSGGDLRVYLPPALTNNTYAITDSTLCCYPAIGHVVAGPSAAAPVSAINMVTGNMNVSYEWNAVTVPAGQSVTLMYFIVQREPTDLTGVKTQAEALVNLTDPNALTGMSAADKAKVINFQIP